MPRRSSRPAHAIALATAALAVTSIHCNQILGLDDFINCPQDPSCPSCSDGKKNGSETDVDCGSECDKCAGGKACNVADDCASGVCTQGKCEAPAGPSCDDGLKNGDETGKDCGGGMCPACPVGEGCIVGTDCESLACGAGHVCVAARCDDMVKNGDETDTDCGGSCAPCAYGQHCAQNEDCANNVCNGVCSGECTPNSMQCSGLVLQTCDTSGLWQSSMTCQYACSAGSCTGVCSPGAKQCSGSTPQTCDTSGQWQSGPACSGATPFCSAGSCIVTPPPSCQMEASGAGPDCGLGSDENCCSSLPVTGGTFYRIYDGATYTNMGFPATVSSFNLDKYEVTVGRFRQFVNAWLAGWRPGVGAGKHSHLNGGNGLANSGSPGTYETGWATAWDSNPPTTVSGWNTSLLCDPTYATWTPSAGMNENRPINCVTWYEAYAFCIWDGGFLPSETEWNYAASGGNEQRVYPWGVTTPGANANLAIYGCYYNGAGSCTSADNIAPVGSAPAGNGKYGQADLEGNQAEWTLDWYAGLTSPCVDCAQLTTAVYRAVRGGAFASPASYVLTSQRSYGSAPRSYGTGMRCARTP